MRDWCKHRYGFVNFDDENLYFTSTGNWSDVNDLGEFNEKTNRKSSSSESYKTISYLGIMSVVVVCLLWWLGFKYTSYSAIVGLFWLGYAAYHYMAKGLTGEFKIPYSNIQSIEVNEQNVDVLFSDFNGKIEKQQLQRVNGKGIDLFLVIYERYLSNESKEQKTDPEHWEI